MTPSDDLFDALLRLLPQSAEPLLAIGEAQALSRLRQKLPRAIAFLLETTPAARRSRVNRLDRALRGDPLLLPFPRGSLEGLISLGALSCLPDAAAALTTWAEYLRPGALLLTAEPLVRSTTVRQLRRLLGGPRFARAPEDITVLLLNAGFGDIGQRLAAGPAQTVLTSGQWRDLTAAPNQTQQQNHYDHTNS